MFTTFERRVCGRPTKTGKPCKANFSGVGFACTLHTTPEEQALVDAYRNGYRKGREEGQTSGRQSAAMSTEYLERQIADLKAQLDQATRRFRVDGLQAVTVGGYAYLWNGQPDLEVGDRVLLPENYVSRLKHGPGPVEGTVTELGTTYDGSHSRILRRIT
ncbi:hypothetical protein KGQ19_25315 [Catenulispora sp. NL8]|uniref:Uncharacterized protein n=1 Tax=Catenulispora pinistramenti TaxID=2705254 RepID=A0ABS5KVU7_9ACTN|nr:MULTISPECIES: hypothetical protein [Catenulispora]MBS2550192.1 hypothetical protein [Catenulispora pinistramenti]